MENRAHALAAGLFTLVLGAALAAVALWFSKDDIKLIPYVMTTSSSVTGLKVEAPVFPWRWLPATRERSRCFDELRTGAMPT
ncbi:MAG: hypothetical protein JJE42_15875 [Burkholderiales bacterium]|nr:hypothetical protein [Burkholderiales bacterium]